MLWFLGSLMSVHQFRQFQLSHFGSVASRFQAAFLVATTLGCVVSAAPLQAAPLNLGSEAIEFNDALRSPYSLVPSTYSSADEGELTVTKSGTYKLEARDGSSFSTSGNQSLKIPVGGGKNYWLAFRKTMPDTDTPVNGVLMYWTKDNSSDAQFLDTTPGTPAGIDDAALSIGRTFFDKAANLYITPTRRIGSSSIEVVINIGKFEGNQPPTLKISSSAAKGVTGKDLSFTAEASDPNGDTLAYYWDFNDAEYVGGVGNAGAKTTHNWEKSADYRVRCTVSDMKGGTASASYVLRIERLPGIEDVSSRHRVSGTVTLDGAPLADALVRIEMTGSVGKNPIIGSTYTDSEGVFTLLNILPGKYLVKATKPGYTIEPIRVATNRTPETVNIARGDVTDVPFAAVAN